MTAFSAEPRWLDLRIAYAIHDRQLSEHGGAGGVRDIPQLESALARPLNKWAYGVRSAPDLAASYAFGIARNHPFVDGNKRTAWVCARLFLALNRIDVAFDKKNAVEVVLALAAGELDEEGLAAWFDEHIVRNGND